MYCPNPFPLPTSASSILGQLAAFINRLSAIMVAEQRHCHVHAQPHKYSNRRSSILTPMVSSFLPFPTHTLQKAIPLLCVFPANVGGTLQHQDPMLPFLPNLPKYQMRSSCIAFLGQRPLTSWTLPMWWRNPAMSRYHFICCSHVDDGQH